ncbi:uncharacterized protein MELLADRAFT_45958 [Melampsora larici-populina 98AG31]|uniref:Major facilitator superfamily (MFS) profile domain-containing protein n=1 Tax=Melampsora larici-populina (strain 98AG31 / pathotype 3-4-7) TaxID=747676 RepID=F4S9H0_MELLP|nr:uncharacterized protein MELLADRAFT_45958 [Melampsora larici-populina 98AG31]EGF98722.1 hypothetical protein MELLADRAFT_45958 [Melampsora larici-populina 98AG31]
MDSMSSAAIPSARTSTGKSDQEMMNQNAISDSVLSKVDSSIAQYVEEPVTKEEMARIRRKIDIHLLPLMMITYFIQFLDKSTIGNVAILGLQKSTHLTVSQYNWLGTIFFVSYLLFEYPQNLALQRFPVGKWISLNAFAWAIFVALQASCKNFIQLFFCRFFLGACEGCATAGFMITTSMFYTHQEQGLRTGFWFLMSGLSVAAGSFISYGVLHIKPTIMEPWQWFFVIIGIVTFLVAVALYLFFPDSPTTAWFLTPEERIKAVSRLRVNCTGIENKKFKKYQAIEAFKDPKTWMWFTYCILATIPNISHQQALIIKAIGYDVFQTSLLTSVIGFVQSSAILLGVALVRFFKDSRSNVAVAMSTVNLIGAICSIALPWSNRVGLLIAIYLNLFQSAAFVITIGWLTATTAGHTKRITVQAFVLTGYCIGNIIAPQLWQSKYKPRNIVPWSIITFCYVFGALILIFMRFYLKRQNFIRDSKITNQVIVNKQKENENENEDKSVKAFMDLTDLENSDYRYVL